MMRRRNNRRNRKRNQKVSYRTPERERLEARALEDVKRKASDRMRGHDDFAAKIIGSALTSDRCLVITNGSFSSYITKVYLGHQPVGCVLHRSCNTRQCFNPNHLRWKFNEMLIDIRDPLPNDRRQP